MTAIKLRLFYRQLALCLVFAAALQPCVPPLLEAAPLPMRDLTVGVAVTPEFMGPPEWKSQFKKRLKYASSIFEREFRIRLKEVIFWTWTPSDPQAGTGEMIDELMDKFPLSGNRVDLIIGLTRLSNLSGSMNMKDLHVLGRARPFSGYMVLRYPDNPLFRIQEETILVHELGHLFGAMHTDAAETIMAPVADRQIPTSFDTENRQVISMTRNLDFRKGTEALPTDVIQRLLNAYKQMMATDQPMEFYYALTRFYLKLDDKENALRTLEYLAKIEPENGLVLHDLGIMYSRTGQYENARKTLNTAIGKMDRESDKKKKASAYGSLGGIYSREGNMQGAYHAWSKALALDPSDKDTRMNLAVVNMERGQAAAAQNEFEKMLAEDPRNPSLLLHLAAAHYHQKKYREAAAHYQLAAKIILDRQSPGGTGERDKEILSEIYTGLGSTFWMMKDESEAAKYLDAACRINPSVSCHEQMGRVYFKLQQWDRAVAELSTALQQNKENGELYGILGVALTKLGQVENAIAVFQEGLRHVRDYQQSARLYANKGHLYMQIKRPEMAITEFMASISRDWNNIDAHFGLGLAYLGKGSFEEAKGAFLNVIKMDSGHEDAKRLYMEAERMIQEEQERQRQQMSFTFQST